ncbi:MAG: alpha-L-fucosidase, partial [Lachnospiraceae bacterium]|nr:alpha-L-fucosidase [Lachnospiraceae bacterium]
MMTNDELLKKLVEVRPSKRQLEWQKLEFTAFFHFGMNTFTDREWGDGKEDEKIYAPEGINTDNWCEAIKAAGINACILTAKHHDGFCLWDTKYTDHSVMNSSYPVDVVRELSRSCEKYGLKFGVYLSPWDRHEKTYGSGREYDDYFCNQLTELCTGYGKLYTVWFDGACGEGPNGKKQIYDWNRYYEVIRKLQPDAVISVSGPDVRWCGNEAGDCRESEWSVVPARLFSQKAIAAASQQADNAAFRERKIDEQDKDLGSLERVKDEKDFIWYPAEVDTSIRPGWFYHESEDEKVRSLEELSNIYLKAVGGNSVLLLNIPPDRKGNIALPDRNRLKELGDYIKGCFSNKVELIPLVNEEKTSICLTSVKPFSPRYAVLKEDITMGQRVEKFSIYADGKKICSGTT